MTHRVRALSSLFVCTFLLATAAAVRADAAPTPPVADDAPPKGDANANAKEGDAAGGNGEADDAAELAAAEASLHYRTDTITLENGLAKIHLTGGYRYLDPTETEHVLTAWGNPAGTHTLGMIVPPNVGVFSDVGYAIVLTYENDGHVGDDDASDIDFDDLLHDMQEQTNTNNTERSRQGFEPVTLVGWAERPHYDANAHKIYWAKHLRFGNANGGDTLNYAVRVLGREGVLELNAVATMNQLAQVKRDMPQVMTFVNFEPGHRYSDFNASSDRVAEYGLAALVAGGVAAKTGVFKGLLALLLAGKKLVIAAFVAIAAGVKNIVARIRGGNASGGGSNDAA